MVVEVLREGAALRHRLSGGSAGSGADGGSPGSGYDALPSQVRAHSLNSGALHFGKFLVIGALPGFGYAALPGALYH